MHINKHAEWPVKQKQVVQSNIFVHIQASKPVSIVGVTHATHRPEPRKRLIWQKHGFAQLKNLWRRRELFLDLLYFSTEAAVCKLFKNGSYHESGFPNS